MVSPELSLDFAGIRMQNPVMVASGTFGFLEEYVGHVNLRRLGAIVLKSVTLEPRDGNPPPRLAETPAGLINAIGIQNIGVKALKREKIEKLKEIGVPLIINIWEESEKGFLELIRILSDTEGIAGVELNLSCPNVGGKLFAQDPRASSLLVKRARKESRFPLIAKLSPQVTDIREIAKACEDGGADAISLINSFPAMAIDVKSRKPVLGNVTGGLSGPAIKPIALKMVWDAARSVKIPVAGMGGISRAEDAIEFLLAGASAVAVGTANFFKPGVTDEIIDGIEEYLVRNGFKSAGEIVGNLNGC